MTDLQSSTTGGHTGLPEHLGTIVEVNGLRLLPPFTRYGKFTPNCRRIPFKELSDTSNLQIWLDNNLYTDFIPVLMSDDIVNVDGYDSSGYDGDGTPWDNNSNYSNVGMGMYGVYGLEDYMFDVDSDIVLINDCLYSNNPTFNFKHVIAISYRADGIYDINYDYDYDVSEGLLTIFKPLGLGLYDTDSGGWEGNVYDTGFTPLTNPLIDVTTFSHSALMNIQTHTFYGEESGRYFIYTKVFKEDYLMVWLNGKRLVDGYEFSISRQDIGYDDVEYDNNAYASDAEVMCLTINGEQSINDHIVVMAFTGNPLHEPSEWGMLSNQSGLSAMGKPAYASNWDNENLEDNPIESIVPATFESPLGPRAGYTLEGTYDIINWNNYVTGSLVSNVDNDSSSIVVHVSPAGIPTQYVPGLVFTAPDINTRKSGAIWINGERIEYFVMTYSNNTYTFTELRRATLGTTLGKENRVSNVYSGDGTTTVFRLTGSPVMVDNIDVLLEENGQMIGQFFDIDYSISSDNNDILVTFVNAPTADQSICLGLTFHYGHYAGSIVYSAIPNKIDDNLGPFQIVAN